MTTQVQVITSRSTFAADLDCYLEEMGFGMQRHSLAAEIEDALESDGVAYLGEIEFRPCVA